MAQHKLAGKLAYHLSNWQVLTKDQWVLNTVQGYSLDFISEPHQGAPPHTPQYSSEQHQLIEEEVRALLKKGAVSEIQVATRPGSIPGTQKRRRAETSDKSQALKPVPPGRTLQDGRDTYPKGHCKARRLARESRPEGCLLHHPNPPIPQGVSKVQISGDTIPVQLPPIWPVLGTLGLYQDPQASDSPPSGDGSADYSIHRRCANLETKEWLKRH